MIKYLKHNQLDKTKWDSCIDGAKNGLIYAYSWYLDVVSPNWDALILGDYEAVMPLPWKRKWGIKYVYQPPYIRQLGVFSNNEHYLQDISGFIQTIPKTFLHVHQNLNTANSVKSKCEKRLSGNLTCWLNLNGTYQKLFSAYSKNHRKNVRRALKNELTIKKINSELFVKNYLLYYSEKGLLDKFAFIEKIFPKLIEELANKSDTVFYGVYTEEKLVASFVQIEKNARILIHTAMTSEGRKKGAVYFLINSIIEQNAESEKILDFAGSNIDSIRYRNMGFGAKESKYYSMYYFLSPWLSKSTK